MTLQEIETTLPNGFHDSKLRNSVIDYEQGIALLEVSVSVGEPDSENPEEYRDARVHISGLLFLCIEAPNTSSVSSLKEGLWLADGHDTRSTPQALASLNPDVLRNIPQDVFVYSFFVNDWNAYMHVAARDAELTWEDVFTTKR